MPGSGTFNDKTFFITNIGRRVTTRATELDATVPLGERRESRRQGPDLPGRHPQVGRGLFPCCPAADCISSEVLVIDGGQWLNKGVFVPPEPGLRYQKV